MSNEFDDEQRKADIEETKARIAKREEVRKELDEAQEGLRGTKRMKAFTADRRKATLRQLTTNVAFHPQGFDRGCGVCKMAPDLQEKLKWAFVLRTRLAKLKLAFPGLTTLDYKRHAKAHGWLYEQAKNTNDVLAMMMTAGVEALITGEITPEFKDLLATIQHIDKREGRIVDKVENDHVVSINFTGNAPAPGPARGYADQPGAALPPRSADPLAIAPISVIEVPNLDTPADPVGKTPVEATAPVANPASLPRDEPTPKFSFGD